MTNIEGYIRQALLRLEPDDTDGRLRVYRAARNVIDKLPSDAKGRAMASFQDAVVRIETEFQRSKQEVESNAEANSHEPTGKEQIGEAAVDATPSSDGPSPRLEPTVQNGLPPDDQATQLQTPPEIALPPEESSPIESRAGWSFPTGPQGRLRWSLLVGLCGLMAMILVSYLVYAWLVSNAPEGSASLSDTEMRERGRVAADGALASALFSGELPRDIGSFAINVTGSKSGKEHLGQHVQDGRFVIDQSVVLFTSEFFDVDPDHTYLMRAVFEDVSGEGSWPILNAGVATFDAEGNIQRDPPGPHRYFLNVGRIDGRRVSEAGGELSFLGLITGTGNEGHDTFRPATAKVRPVVSISMKEGDRLLVLKRVEFTDLQ